MAETLTDTPRSTRPSGPKGRFLSGSLSDFRDDPIRFLSSNQEAYGDIAFFRFLGLPVYQVSHPDDVRTVLVDPEGAFTKGEILEGFRPLVGKGILLSEGDVHKRKRRMMQPAFHPKRVKEYAAEMVREAEALVASWEHGQEVDMAAEMNRVTLAIASRTLFGAELTEREMSDVAAAMRAFAGWYHQSTHPLGRLLQHFPTEATVAFREAKKRLSAVIHRMMRERRKSGDTGDILSMLVFAKDADGDGAAFTDEEIHDEAVTLLVAGHETTGATLAWAFARLSDEPEVAEKLAAEADRVLGDRSATFEDVPKLVYAEGVFAETLRFYPSALALPRQAQKDVVLAGHEVPKGSIVLTAAYCVHRDPRFWDEPEAFRPERWEGGARKARTKMTYFPFGGGSRVCIGEAFAWMEGTLLLATIARAFVGKRHAGHPLASETLFTNRPKGGVPMTLASRSRRPR